MSANAKTTTSTTEAGLGSPQRLRMRTGGARMKERMTASASGTKTAWPKYRVTTMMKPITAVSAAEALISGTGTAFPAASLVIAMTTNSRDLTRPRGPVRKLWRPTLAPETLALQATRSPETEQE